MWMLQLVLNREKLNSSVSVTCFCKVLQNYDNLLLFLCIDCLLIPSPSNHSFFSNILTIQQITFL